MEKLLINLFVPAVQESYDVFVPADLELHILTKVLSDSIPELDNNRYSVSGREMLIQCEPEQLLNPRKTLAEYGIRDGARLVLL